MRDTIRRRQRFTLDAKLFIVGYFTSLITLALIIAEAL